MSYTLVPTHLITALEKARLDLWTKDVVDPEDITGAMYQITGRRLKTSEDLITAFHARSCELGGYFTYTDVLEILTKELK